MNQKLQNIPLVKFGGRFYKTHHEPKNVEFGDRFYKIYHEPKNGKVLPFLEFGGISDSLNYRQVDQTHETSNKA